MVAKRQNLFTGSRIAGVLERKTSSLELWSFDTNPVFYSQDSITSATLASPDDQIPNKIGVLIRDLSEGMTSIFDPRFNSGCSQKYDERTGP